MSDSYSYPYPYPPPQVRDSLTEGVIVRRIIAFLIDGIIVTAICAVLWVVLVAFGVLTFGLGFPLLGVLPIVPVLYNWLTVVSSMSATPGQRVMGLMVRRADDLGRPSAVQSAIWVAGFIITISLGAIWFAIALLTERNRTVHDLISGLVVVRSRALTEREVIWDDSYPRETIV